MTTTPTSRLDQIAARSHHLLLDFDGPVCTVFAGIPAAEVAELLRVRLQQEGVPMPETVIGLGDPLEVFRIVAGDNPDVTIRAQQELTSLELEAIIGARPTKGSAELIATARVTGRTVSIITNNSEAAVHAYLRSFGLDGCVGLVIGRDDADPELMKPSPYGVRAAVGILDTTGADCVFVGDSTTDVLAGLLAGVPVIGYANKPDKAEALTQAGARAVTTRLSEITTALRTTPPASTAELSRT